MDFTFEEFPSQAASNLEQNSASSKAALAEVRLLSKANDVQEVRLTAPNSLPSLSLFG